MAEKMIFCKACGKEIAKSAKTCPNCGKRNKKPFWQKLIILAIIIGILVIISKFSGGNENQVSQTKAPSIPKAEYIASCQTYAYNDIARNPDNYKGKPAFFTGEIIQVQESGKKIMYRINVTKGTYSWSDTIYVDYTRSNENESRILEKDIVKVYGQLNGLKTYRTVLGGELSIPWLIAYYFEPIK